MTHPFTQANTCPDCGGQRDAHEEPRCESCDRELGGE